MLTNEHSSVGFPETLHRLNAPRRAKGAQQWKESPAKCGRLLPTSVRSSTSVKVRTLTLLSLLEIGHEKAQNVIDSITSSYAAEGQAGANPMLQQPGGVGPGMGPPPPFGFPGGSICSNVFCKTERQS